MELTYLNNNFIEQGAILDFKIDLAYGTDENNFEMKTPENKMTVGDFWSCGSYGGIVDEIAKVSNEELVTYRGRSVQGILDGFYCYQLEENDFFSLSGDNLSIKGLPSNILKSVAEQLEIPFVVVNEIDPEETEISITIDRGLSIYQMFMAMPNKKLLFDYERNVGFTIEITNSVDYTINDEFDATQYAINISVNNKIPNHLIGVFKKDDKTVVKNLYFNENGELQPYYILDSDNQEPMHDAEFERVEDEPVIKGKDEVIEVINGGSTIENTVMVKPLTESDGNTLFVNNVPFDWNENFSEYMREIWDDSKGETVFEKLPVEPRYTELVIPSAAWWQVNWGAFFKKEYNPDIGEYEYKQLTDSDVREEPQYVRLTPSPTEEDWRKNWQNYFRRYAEDDYRHFEGISVPGWLKETSKNPTPMWSEDRGSYYINWKRPEWTITVYGQKNNGWKKVDSYVVKDSLTLAKPNNSNHTFAWWKNKEGSTFIVTFKAGATTVKQKYVIGKKRTYRTEYITLRDYTEILQIPLTGKKGIKWGQFTLYLRYEKSVEPPLRGSEDVYIQQTLSGSPPLDQTYYKEDGVVIPYYEQGKIYRKIEDNYSNLISKMLERLEEIKKSSIKIEPVLDIENGEFDVGDIIGGTHPFTDGTIKSTISKKIVKINSYGITISYDV